MKKGDKEWLIFAEPVKWISSIFTSHCCPWFLSSRSTTTATAPGPSTSVDGTSKGLSNHICSIYKKAQSSTRKENLSKALSFFIIIIEEQLENGKEGKGNKEQKGAREEKQGIGRRTGDLRKRGRAKTGN